MNLKKIELLGFKSFADKTEIPFESNITGIVGPNGCGKSNVIDAVRWVLGEQAPSTLRVTKMPDLIFNGTANRRSLSYCEVSLYLDNSDHRYPIDFDEVVVTRKLDRSGESEYLINKQSCRLRDVIDLFRDSGIGKEGYSIIGQGKIDEILSSKPDGRRKIFEEAAGISRHKARKIETERKLDRARQDMARISDILTEVASSLGPLEQEAKDAAKAKALRAELKFQEVSQFLYQCENSSANREKIRTKLNKLTEELESETKEWERLNSDYNVTMMGIENGDKYSNMVRDNITSLMVAAEKAAGDGRALGKDIDHIKEDNTKIKDERLSSRTKLDEKARLIEEKFALSVEKRDELALKKDALIAVQKAYNEISHSVEQQEKAIEASTEMFVNRLSKTAALEKDVAELELERKMLLDSVASDKDEYNDKKNASDKISKERDEFVSRKEFLLREKEEKQAELAVAEDNKRNADNELKELLTRKTELETRIQNLDFKRKTIEENISNYFDYEDSIQNLMSYAQKHPEVSEKIVATVAEVMSVPKDLQLAIEISLGRSLQNIITRNEYDASDLMRTLRENNLGRATFLPMTTIKYADLSREQARVTDEDGVIGIASELVNYDSEYDNIFSNLLGRTVIVEDQKTALRVSKKYGYSFRTVTLEGDVYATSGALTGGTAVRSRSRILSRESEKEDIVKKLRQAKKDLELFTLDAESRTAECKELANAVGVIGSRLAKLDVEITAVQGEIDRCDKQIALFESDLKKLFEGKEGDLKRIQEIETMLKEVSRNKQNIDSEKVDADDYVAELKNKYYEDKQRREAVNAEVTEAMMAVNAVQNEIETLEKDIAALKAECKMLEQSLLELDMRERFNTTRLAQIEAQLEKSVFSKEDQDKLNSLRAELEGLEQKKVEMNALVKELDAKRIEQNEIVNKTNEKRIREEANLAMIDSQIEAMSQRMQENYGYDFDMAKSYRDGIDPETCTYVFDPNKANAEINSLRKRIERIGPVNELAEEKFAEESNRYSDLQRQYDDVAKAEQDLMGIIAELTSEMIEKFTASFNQINKNFNEVFRELFGGGSARMELEKGVSVLDAGIEIMAEPPGKKLSNLAPLSGGERALTAIAILFAIIKLKPMPFSILDEIEAALDDANVHLFAQYLNKFSQYTQFIVVTHRKPTMQLCDTLFGITMQEKGVSKTVRAKLEEAYKHAEEPGKKGDDNNGGNVA